MADEMQDLKNELEFMDAMRAYRRAREKGDPEEIRKAENAWREQVRREMIENESCTSDATAQ